MDFRNFIQYVLIPCFIPGVLLGSRKMEQIRPSYLPSRSSRAHERRQMCEHMNIVIGYAQDHRGKKRSFSLGVSSEGDSGGILHKGFRAEQALN